LKKILILLPLLLFNTTFVLFAQTIKNIEFSGNKKISRQKIMSLMQTKPGMDLNTEILDRDMKKIGEAGFFKSIRYEIETSDEGATVKFYLVENPVIESIDFKGNRALKTKKLAELIGVKKGDIFNEILLKEGIAAIENKYREQGFKLATVKTAVVEQKEKETVAINILVSEGGKSYVREISIEGNSFFSCGKIKKMIKTKERRMPFKRGTFKEDIFEKDIKILETSYRNAGFIDIEITKNILPHEKGGMLINLTIKEGKQFFLGEITFKGDILVEEKILKDLLPLKEKGSVFNKELLDQNRKKISDFYMDKSYITAKVMEIPLPSDKPDVINITYLIEPGDIYCAGEIKVIGNKKTKDKVIRRELKIEPSDTITSSAVRKSFNKLFDLNYFEKIDIYPEFTDTPGVANVVVDVEEKAKTGLFIIGGGYSSVDDIIGVISIQQTNFDIKNPWSFTGGGQNLGVSLELGTEARNYRISFTEPYFLDKPVSVGADIYRTRREWSDYTEEATGIDLRVSRRWENISLGFTAKTELIDLSDIEIVSVQGQAGEKRKNSLTATLTHSTLDSVRTPSKGNMARLSIESAGGIFQGDVDFIKPVFENDFYYPFQKFVFHSKTRAGFIEETEDTDDIPIYERFWGGGIGTVRGYKERTISPQDETTGEFVGGKALFAQNFELIYPLYQNILKGVVFFDAGNVWDSFEDFSDLLTSVGVGIKVVVPILNAPIEVYYGYALDQRPGDSNGRVHLGMSFGF